MATTYRPVPDDPEFTLEEAKEWLLIVEDNSAIARDLGFATRFVLANLLNKLSMLGILDVRQFLEELRQHIPLLEPHERVAAQVLIDALMPPSGEQEQCEIAPKTRH